MSIGSPFVLVVLAILGAITGMVSQHVMGRNKVGPIWVTTLLGLAGSLPSGIGTLYLGLDMKVVDWVLIPAIFISPVIGSIALIWLYSIIKRRVVQEKGNAAPVEALSAPLVEATLPQHSADRRSFEIPKRKTDDPVSIGYGGDIFVSYASPDRPTAQALARALHEKGWSVWWDRTIPPGKTFDEVIEAALNRAKCVIVLWSKTAVTSEWVKAEAAEAARRRILIPALIEEVTVPLEFRRIQAASLVDWSESRPHPGFQSLVASIADLLGKPDVAARLSTLNAEVDQSIHIQSRGATSPPGLIEITIPNADKADAGQIQLTLEGPVSITAKFQPGSKTFAGANIPSGQYRMVISAKVGNKDVAVEKAVFIKADEILIAQLSLPT